MDESRIDSVDALVEQYERKALSRGRFLTLAAGVGITATGAAAMLASMDSKTARAAPPQPAGMVSQASQQRHLAAHDAHLQSQGATTHSGSAAGHAQLDAARKQALERLLDDYADDAVVEDPLNHAPVTGKEAIAQRKLEEMTSMRNVTLTVNNRFAHGNQVIAEWVMRGTHVGPYKGYTATNREITLNGVTVVTRQNGKIVKESIFYDVDKLIAQLT
jgi:steroid delta-isomerase-like uncharacterized protein